MASPRALPRRQRENALWGIGIVGGGDISGRYADCIQASQNLRLCGISASEEKTRELITDPNVDIILNLTPPLVHERVSRAALREGKHVYSEKPLAQDLSAADGLNKLADERGLLLACAPATFLGPAQQSVRSLLDAGALGPLIGARGIMMYPGPDKWHPNPAPLFGAAAGPLFDMGVYHLTALVALLGPIQCVTAMGNKEFATRSVAKGPRAGKTFEVVSPTHVCALVKFDSGPLAQLTLSFDGVCSAAPSWEIFGTKGSLSLPPPGQFSSIVKQASAYDVWVDIPATHDDWDDRLWIAGIYAMVDHLEGLDTPWPNPDLALHVLDAMVSIETSMSCGETCQLTTTCERPEPLRHETIRRWTQNVKRAA